MAKSSDGKGDKPELVIELTSSDDFSSLLYPIVGERAELVPYKESLPSGGSLTGDVLKHEITPEYASHQLRLVQMDVDRSIELATIQQRTEEIRVEGAKEIAKTRYVQPMRIAAGPVWATVVLAAASLAYSLCKDNTPLALGSLGALVGLSVLTQFLPKKKDN